MSQFRRPAPKTRSALALRQARLAAPRCKAGASSMLRLTQAASPQHGGNLAGWLAKAAGVLSPAAVSATQVRPSEFAPSQWLIGH